MNTTEKGTNPLRLSNNTYDRLKVVALVVIPALATLYFALGAIWDFPYIEEVLGSAVALETFLGALLGLSNKKYKEEKTQQANSKLVVSPYGEVYADFEFDPKELGHGEDVNMTVVKTHE